MFTVEPLKTATLREMENWPSYGGGRLIEVIYLPTIECILSYFKLNIVWYATIYTVLNSLSIFWGQKYTYRSIYCIPYTLEVPRTSIDPRTLINRAG